MGEAELRDGIPVTAGWFVVNARDARWLHNELRATCRFEGTDEDDARFGEFGIGLYWVQPGRAMTLYHHESAQEDFLVLRGDCTLVIEGAQRTVGPWDFVHCPPGTAHTIACTGSEPALLLAVGARPEGRSIAYPVEPRAIALGAGVPDAHTSAREHYASFGAPLPGPPPSVL